MAARSRLSLRSSHKGASLDESSATAAQHVPSTTKRGKRARDLLPDNDSINKPLKAPKLSTRNRVRPKVVVQVGGDDSPISALQVPTSSATHVKSEHNNSVQPNTNGSGLSGSQSTIADSQHGQQIGTSTGRMVDKRSLRSHDGGSRSKSELEQYFPNYEELVSIEPKELEFLTPSTILYITDEPTRAATSTTLPSRPRSKAGSQSTAPSSIQAPTTNGFPQRLAHAIQDPLTIRDATRIDFSSIIERNITQSTHDPLNDDFYLKAHRRAERREKQLRNIEKERAQHEKVQLEQLLEGLKGHDWLRVMGISGITDTEKKSYEPKREYFIEAVASLLKKFREWKEEEKRRKIERDERLAELEAEDDEEGEDEENEEEGGEEGDDGTSQLAEDAISDGDPPDFSDVDMLAARQLHHEAVSASGLTSGNTGSPHHQPSAPTPTIDKPFTSFFAKSYLRDAALGKHRRGRARFAFGQPVPDVSESTFDLPHDMRSDDLLAASARSRRRAKRESKERKRAAI